MYLWSLRLIITVRERSVGQGNMFTGVCLPIGGVPDQVHPRDQVHPPEQTPPTPQSSNPLGADPLEQTPLRSIHHPQEQTPPGSRQPPGADTPQSRHPPGSRQPPGADTPPRRRACWEIRSTCGRYASHWNAILFISWIFRKKNRQTRVGIQVADA